jgi:hypothetical protein
MTLLGMQNEFSAGCLFDPQCFKWRRGGTLDRISVTVEAASVAGTGESIELNLDGATQVRAHQAHGCEPAVVMDKHRRDFRQSCL